MLIWVVEWKDSVVVPDSDSFCVYKNEPDGANPCGYLEAIAHP
jgi:hypothetical protein